MLSRWKSQTSAGAPIAKPSSAGRQAGGEDLHGEDDAPDGGAR